MATFVPAEVFPPGEIIREELKVRGWTQADLAEVMERPLQMINEIVGAKKRITEETAKELEAALGIEAEFWMKTEALFRLYNSEPAPSDIKRRAAVRRRVPLRHMLTRDWLQASDEVAELENSVKAYLGVLQLEDRPEFAMAAKQTAYDRPLTPVQEVWLLRLKKLAEAMFIPSYSAARLESAVTELRGLLRSPDEVRHAPRILAEAGVRFVVVERLPGLGIDGVCFWLSATKPVIGMSLSRDRIDNFWFVLRHEIEHVLNGDGKSGALVDNDLDEAADVSDLERRANAAAADFCVPKIEMDDFIRRKSPLFTDDNIRQFAHSLGLHSGLVAGQLRRRLGAWSKYTTHLAKVRHVITDTALVDGFGSTPQLDVPYSR